jgi:cobalt-zinc-cadmium resistance protein CzcA
MCVDATLRDKAAKVQANIARQVKLPAGYSIEFGGQFENQKRATKRS